MQIQEIETEKLNFDPENPRFFRLGRELKLEETVSEMLEDEGVRDLMESIGTKGYFPGEPLLVTENAGQYIVMEGNRRLTAVKLLNGELEAPSRKQRMIENIRSDSQHKPQKLPCVICPDRGAVLEYLGFRHVSGVKEWDALSKAFYVEKLLDRDTESENYKQKLIRVKKQIGTSADYLARLMAALKLYSVAQEAEFFKLSMSTKDVEFSLITTSLSYSDIRSWLGLENLYEDIEKQIKSKNLGLMFKFLFVVRSDATTVIRESRQLREFSHIVAHEEALDVLGNTGDIEAALLLTDGPSEALLNFLERSSNFVKQAWVHIGDGRVKVITEDHIEIAEKLKNQSASVLQAMKNIRKEE